MKTSLALGLILALQASHGVNALARNVNGTPAAGPPKKRPTTITTAFKAESFRQKRKPSFPRKAYSLLKDEQELKHNFISFIDQSLFKEYSQTVRLVEPRLYARPDQFLRQNLDRPPTVEDVAEPASFYGKLATFLAWNGLPARAVVGTLSYLAFPYIIEVLSAATVNVTDEDLATLVNTFIPAISIVLGTYFSLTLSILYDRFTKLQETLNLEAGLLALTCNNLLALFDDNQDAAVEGAQCICDQIRTMVFDSRGKETMGVIYNDPYARILKLVNKHKKQQQKLNENNVDAQLFGEVHNTVTNLVSLRSKRMNYESLALSPTHFEVMTFLSGMLMVGYALATVATAPPDGVPIELARILFAALISVFTVFYEMSFDLNRPFDGVYQLRRQATAMSFLQVKLVVTNNPLVAGLVDFEEIEDEDITFECDRGCETDKRKTWFN